MTAMEKYPESPSIHFARVPVCDNQFNVLAYELVACETESLQPSLSEIISSALTDPRIHDLLNNRPALVYSQCESLRQLYSELNFPLDQFWLMCNAEEAIHADIQLIQGLKKRGAKLGLALNNGDLPSLPTELTDQISFFRTPINNYLSRSLSDQTYSHWLKIACHVDDQELFNQVQQYDVKGIQGRYLPRPQKAEFKRFPSNKLIALEILNMVSDINVAFDDLEKLIVQDLQLYYKLLRFINSAYYSFNRKINNIKEALIYLGLNTLRSLTLVIALSESTNRSPDLFYLALTRAKMCELLASDSGWPNEAVFFNAGLISLLDVLLDIPMAMILSELPLSTVIKDAVLHFEGRTGAALQCAMYYENVDWQKIEDSQFEKDLAHTAYLEASRWATALQQSLMAMADSQEC